MKRLLLIFTILFCFTVANAQNPFEAYGYTPKIATLSNGKYNEFHDLDTIVQIGTVLFNTQSKQIVAFLQIDTLYSEATLQPDIVSMWLSPDPLSDEYPSTSPYMYCLGNPIVFVDPDGRFVKGFVATWDEGSQSYNKVEVNDKGGDKINYTEYRGGKQDGMMQTHDLENKTFEWKDVSSSEISPVTGTPSGKGALTDANWIIDLAAGGISGIMTSASKVAAKSIAEEGANLVYQGLDKTGVVKYVGITGRDAAVRFGEHLGSNTAKSFLRYEVIPGATNLSKTGARIWEQNLINQFGLSKNGGQLLNKINSIAPKNWLKFGIK